MKRIGLISFFVIILTAGAFVIVPLTSRASCFRNGAISNSIAQATEEVVKLLLHTRKDDWAAIEVSERELLGAITALEVNGPAMAFEHHSTRYITFRLSVCPAITEPIIVGVHCDDTSNLGWIAGSCLGREN
ncbi:MAG: hypothetical protein ABJM43_24045 [Paracoccaceae bacterium]